MTSAPECSLIIFQTLAPPNALEISFISYMYRISFSYCIVLYGDGVSCPNCQTVLKCLVVIHAPSHKVKNKKDPKIAIICVAQGCW